jgi:hypothetical protein
LKLNRLTRRNELRGPLASSGEDNGGDDDVEDANGGEPMETVYSNGGDSAVNGDADDGDGDADDGEDEDDGDDGGDGGDGGGDDDGVDEDDDDGGGGDDDDDGGGGDDDGDDDEEHGDDWFGEQGGRSQNYGNY